MEEPYSGLVGSPGKRWRPPQQEDDEECSEIDPVADLMDYYKDISYEYVDPAAQEMEQNVMDLNKRAMEHLGRE
jgi:hypothetical protein